jgi:cytidine deaminase
MVSKKIEIQYSLFETIEELHSEDQALVMHATTQLNSSYAPYSKFNVGAAVRLQSGKIITGSNQENAAYPLCICAEQVVLSQCGALHPNDPIISLAITVRSTTQKISSPVSPCGACRQVIKEYTNRQSIDFSLLLKGETGPTVKFEKASSLLPFAFDGSILD